MITDFDELMAILSQPRPNGSRGERETRLALLTWLEKRGIPYHTHRFRQYPFFFECIGVWLILSRTLLAVSVWLRGGWITTLIALMGLLGGVLDVLFNLPLVTWPGWRWGENILIELHPPDPQREVVISAHYDSKTELLDHHQRMFFLKNLRLGIFLSLLLAALGPLDAWLLAQGASWATFTFWVGTILTLPLLFLAWGLGLNLSTGRLLAPSQGAVDNGAACAILLGLAERLCAGEIPGSLGSWNALQSTQVTLALFTGEEINMQGSHAYVRSREWPLPAQVLNLEVMAQDGDYVFWEQDGNSFHLSPTSPEINSAINEALLRATGAPGRLVGPVNSDGASFLSAGIPTGVLGTYDRHFVDTGFHRPTDCLSRVAKERLARGVEILICFLINPGSDFEPGDAPKALNQ